MIVVSHTVETGEKSNFSMASTHNLQMAFEIKGWKRIGLRPHAALGMWIAHISVKVFF